MVRLNLSYIKELPEIPGDELVKRYKSLIIPLKKAFLSRLELSICLLDDEQKGKIVLEVGSGCGILLPSLCNDFDFVIGLDIHGNLYYVKRFLKQIGKTNIDLVRADVNRLPFKNHVFYDVICISVLDHLDKPDLAINEIRRVVRSGGTVVFSFHKENPINFIMHLFFTFYSWLRRDITDFWKHVQEHINSDGELLEIISKRFLVEKINYLGIIPVYMAIRCVNQI